MGGWVGGRGGARRGREREANRKEERRGREKGEVERGETERERAGEHIILITDDSCTVLLFPQNRKPLH